jgi:hypothetical protein
MDGGARVAARGRISRFTIRDCEASQEMIQSKISLRFALRATQSCIGELIEDCFLMGPSTTRLINRVHFAALSASLSGVSDVQQ